jgi:hypothetical protein
MSADQLIVRKNGQIRFLRITTVVEIEDEITMDQVPPAVKETLKRGLPQFTPTFSERSQRTNFQTWYEFEPTFESHL